MAPAVSARPALASELRIAVLRLSRRLRAQRVDDTLGLGQLSALAAVEVHGPCTPGELAEHERVQPPSISRILARLTELELVTRTPDPHDGRQQVVSIAPAGKERLAADRKRREAWLAQRLRELSAQDVAALRAAIPVLARLAGSTR